jgi:4-hydroxy-tetrahydrodipicolinate synthase
VGCISATANVNPGAIHHVFEQWETADADRLQTSISITRNTIQKYHVIGALKAIVAHYSDDPDWVTVRPPLIELGAEKTRSLVGELDRLGFAMPGLAEAAARV